MRTIPSVMAFVLAAAVGCAGDDDSGSGGTGPVQPVADMDAPCSEYDSRSDGSVDTVYRYTYDADGFLVSYTGEPGGISGDITYDANHFTLHHAYNGDADATLEFEETFTRDSAGRVLTYEQRDETGVVETSTYTYDAIGRVTRSVVGRRGSAGAVTSTTDYVYTGDQRNPTSARLVYPDGATAIVYTSSADQLMLHADLDDGEDGTVDRTTDVTYDGHRRIVSSISRTMGMVTTRQTAAYNGRGSLVQSTYADTEVGTPDDYVYTAQYSGAGMLMQAQVTTPSGDFADSIYTEIYKSECLAATMTVAPRGARTPMHLRPTDRPLTFAAP